MSPGNLKFLFLEAVDEPSSADNDCHEIDKNHLVEFEDLGGEWPEKERGDKKKNMKSFVNEFCSRTELSLCGIGACNFWVLRF